MIRREFIKYISCFTAAGFVTGFDSAYSIVPTPEMEAEATTKIFDSIVDARISADSFKLPIGELIGQIAGDMKGIAYVGGTLERDGAEICRVDLTGLDCVTFFENALAIARMLKRPERKIKFEDMLKELTYTRYRDGKLTDYSSRLHYTADWIDNNIAKGVVKSIINESGGEIFPLKVSFMSEHPQYYAKLKNNPDMTAKIAVIEKAINSKTHYYIPKNKVAAAEKYFQTGDIVAIATSMKGLDYSHTGLIIKDSNDKALFMHASSKHKKVILDKRISEYLKSKKSNIGITVVRPVEI